MTYETIEPPFQDNPRLAYAERILIVLGMLVLFFFAGKPSSDGIARYLALDQLLRGGGVSGSAYSMIGPIFATPLWYLGKLFGSTEWWVGKFNSIIFMIGTLWLWRMLKPNVSASFIRKFILLLIAASMFGRPAMGFFGEMFTTVMVACGILALAFRPSILAWTAIILGVGNTPATVIGLSLFAMYHAYHHRRLRYLLVPLVSVLLILGESWLRRGSPFVSGYEGNLGGDKILMAPYSGLPGFSYPFILGVLGIFLSFGKGLLFFTPGLFLPVRRRLESFDPALTLAYTSWLAFLAGVVVVYSKWWDWSGDWYWGPRFFLIASVISCFVVAVHLVRPSTKLVVNAIVLLVLVLSLWVGFSGLVFDNTGLTACNADQYRLAWTCLFVPEYSVLIHPFIEPRPLETQELAVSGYLIVTAAVLVGPHAVLTGRQLASQLHNWLVDARQGWRV